jgi:hypothetical protein
VGWAAVQLAGITPDRLLALAFVAGGVGMFGLYLDTAWHRTLGRDTFWSLPHLLMYGGGIAVYASTLACIVVATRVGPRGFGGPVPAWRGLRFPLGFALAFAGTLVMLTAIPVDAWFHWMFGTDVLVWSWPHMQLLLGAGLTDFGILLAVAAQRGRGWFGRPRVWPAAMALVIVDLLQRVHYGLAHYTQVPETRTADFYPMLVALAVPALLVTAVRAIGPWAPVAAAGVFFGAQLGVDLALYLIDFARYTLTPVFALPALLLRALYAVAGRARDRAVLAIVAGILFSAAFVAIECIWMASVIARPWAGAAVSAALPVTIGAGALSGWVGWVVGGFVRAVAHGTSAGVVFGDRPSPRAAALLAAALILAGSLATYRPQRFGPPMTTTEMQLRPVESFPAGEAIFWEALIRDEWSSADRIQAYSEGIIEPFPVPIGPAWCAATPAQLEAELPGVRFGLVINGESVDLAPYRVVRLPLRDGRHCGWLGVAAASVRASRNRFVYEVERAAGRSIVEMTVVFKDP